MMLAAIFFSQFVAYAITLVLGLVLGKVATVVMRGWVALRTLRDRLVEAEGEAENLSRQVLSERGRRQLVEEENEALRARLAEYEPSPGQGGWIHEGLADGTVIFRGGEGPGGIVRITNLIVDGHVVPHVLHLEGTRMEIHGPFFVERGVSLRFDAAATSSG